MDFIYFNLKETCLDSLSDLFLSCVSVVVAFAWRRHPLDLHTIFVKLCNCIVLKVEIGTYLWSFIWLWYPNWIVVVACFYLFFEDSWIASAISFWALFIYFGYAGSSLLCTGFLWLRWSGAALPWGAQAYHCGGCFCCGAWARGTRASAVAPLRV